ncbi:MAG: carbohydrate kinase family protein [Chloroflexi bacterium]|nr:carbohydrate kinase family protein [Chloroflexota bacterium]
MADVIGLGALNVDHIYRVDCILHDGEAVVNEVVSLPGGSAANTIYGLSRLGIKTGFIGAVADDDDGRLAIEDLRRAGVDTAWIEVKPQARTGATLCLSDSNARSIYVLPGANSLLTADDIDLRYINGARLLHLSSLVDEAQLDMLSGLMGRLKTVKVSFAPGTLYTVKGLKALSPILARSTLLFVNEDEIRQLTGHGVEDGAGLCLESGADMVVVTMALGAYIRDARDEYFVEAPARDLNVADTTGAGDAFAAGFLYGWLRGKGTEECGRLGHAVARLSITHLGARQGLPNAEELEQHYRQLYARD